MNFYYLILRFWNTRITNKKAHDLLASILVFPFCDTFEIFQISESQRKAKTLLCQYVETTHA